LNTRLLRTSAWVEYRQRPRSSASATSPLKRGGAGIFAGAPASDYLNHTDYWQPGNLNDAIQVLHPGAGPVLLMYSVVYQKVQSSPGSIESAL